MSAEAPGIRAGIGYDSHRFAAEGSGRRLLLGGVEIPGSPGLEGHSDADVLAHAVTDALLGACGLGDLGTHFPPSDERWRDADSMDLLARAVELALREASAAPLNLDATVICEEPRLAEYRGAMEKSLSKVASAPVSVKATTNEGMGWIGRGEGIACLAVALVSVDRANR